MNLSRLNITNTEDENWLRESTINARQEILTSLWIEKHSWLFANIKNYLTNIINTDK